MWRCPGTGLTFPPDCRPTPRVMNGTTYFPQSGQLGKNEMRITFMGSCRFPPRKSQASTCILVEFGNGRNFIFGFGPGCLRNLVAHQVPIATANDILPQPRSPHEHNGTRASRTSPSPSVDHSDAIRLPGLPGPRFYLKFFVPASPGH